MKLADILRLLLLAAIWGASFLFLRIGVPSLGPAWLIELRLLVAGVLLATVMAATGRPMRWREHWRHYLILGTLNSGLPFILLAYAVQTLTASMLAILNATSPIFAAVVTAVWHRERPRAGVLAGLVLGLAGVAIVVGIDGVRDVGAQLAVLAALGATLSYGIASIYAARAPLREPFANANGSMWGAALVVLPLALASPIPAAPSALVVSAVLALGVVCSGFAYIVFFRLIETVGATSALAVTFLIPVFGVLWGVIFLDEPLGPNTFVGAAVVLLGTALVTGVVGGRRRRAAESVGS